MIFLFGLTIKPGLFVTRQSHSFPARRSFEGGRGSWIKGNRVWFTTTLKKPAHTKQPALRRAPSREPNKRLYRYTKEEDAIITALRSQRTGWTDLQKALPHRTIHGLKHRWAHYLRPNVDFESERLCVPYTTSDEEKMTQLRQAGLTWKQIQQAHFPKRNWRGLKTHFSNNILVSDHFRDSSGLAWTVDERRKLYHLKDELGLSWKDVCKQFPNRTAPALRTRYKRLEWYKPKRKQKYYSPEEDATLLRLKV